MKNVLKIFVILMCCVVGYAQAGAPTCSANHGGFCSYGGKVSRIYVNSSNVILLYFDTAVDLSVPKVAGFTIASGDAAAFKIDDNPEFANYFYSTALAAQASGRSVSIQMRGVESGYLKFDRIWLRAP